MISPGSHLLSGPRHVYSRRIFGHLVRMLGLTLGLMLLLATGPATAQSSGKGVVGKKVEQEIAHLLGFIRSSACLFIRNGDPYDGPAAAEHVQDKYDYYRDQIDSADAFIDRAASRSQLSGRAYQVSCPGAALLPARDWLSRELASYRAHTPSPGPQAPQQR